MVFKYLHAGSPAMNVSLITAVFRRECRLSLACFQACCQERNKTFLQNFIADFTMNQLRVESSMGILSSGFRQTEYALNEAQKLIITASNRDSNAHFIEGDRRRKASE